MLTPIISVKQVTKKIKNKIIINNVSFDVYPGEVFGFLGPNGAGKTTTIRMLVGLISVTSGAVYIKGKNLKDHFEEAISEIGAIVENPEMYPYLTGYQHLLHYSRMATNVTTKRIDEMVELVGLSDSVHQKVRTFSLGMRQRLGIAQALLHSPSILILDEPTNGLDPAGVREIRDYIKKLAKEEGLAVIVSSHLLAEMELMCDKIGILQHGKLISVQSITDFIRDETNKVVRYEVDNPEKAREVLISQFPTLPYVKKGKRIEIVVDKSMIPRINEAFVLEKIQVYQISNPIKSLEDRFLEVTGGESVG